MKTSLNARLVREIEKITRIPDSILKKEITDFLGFKGDKSFDDFYFVAEDDFREIRTKDDILLTRLKYPKITLDKYPPELKRVPPTVYKLNYTMEQGVYTNIKGETIMFPKDL